MTEQEIIVAQFDVDIKKVKVQIEELKVTLQKLAFNKERYLQSVLNPDTASETRTDNV
jgi:hypothetical protein